MNSTDRLNQIYKNALGAGVRKNLNGPLTPVADSKQYVKDTTDRFNGTTLNPRKMTSERFSYEDQEKTAPNNWTPKTKNIIQRVLNWFKKNEPKSDKDELSPKGWFRGTESHKDKNGNWITENKRSDEYDSRRQAIYDKALQEAKNARGGKKVSASDKDVANKAAETEMREGDNRERTMDIPSTALDKIHYDPKTKGLTVTFTSSNKEYFYPDVPADVIEGLMKASSKGNYFMTHIHDQYSIYGANHQKKSKAQQKAIKKFQKAYTRTNKQVWKKNGGK